MWTSLCLISVRWGTSRECCRWRLFTWWWWCGSSWIRRKGSSACFPTPRSSYSSQPLSTISSPGSWKILSTRSCWTCFLWSNTALRLSFYRSISTCQNCWQHRTTLSSISMKIKRMKRKLPTRICALTKLKISICFSRYSRGIGMFIEVDEMESNRIWKLKS